MISTVKQINNQNAYDVTYENGAQILKSYSTPVAAYIPALGYLETTTKFSVTTSKHISQWKKRMGYPLTARVEQREIEGWMEKLDRAQMNS